MCTCEIPSARIKWRSSPTVGRAMQEIANRRNSYFNNRCVSLSRFWHEEGRLGNWRQPPYHWANKRDSRQVRIPVVIPALPRGRALLWRVHQRALGSLNQVLAHEKVVIPGLHAAEGVVDGKLVV